MFQRFGCGCIYLITERDPGINGVGEVLRGRLIEDCRGDDYGPSGPSSGPEENILAKIRPENLVEKPQDPYDHFHVYTPAEEDALFNQITALIHDGYRYRELRMQFSNMLSVPQKVEG